MKIIVNVFNKEDVDKAIEEIISTLEYEGISFDIEKGE